MLTLQHYANELQQLQSKFENTNGIGIKVWIQKYTFECRFSQTQDM